MLGGWIDSAGLYGTTASRPWPASERTTFLLHIIHNSSSIERKRINDKTPANIDYKDNRYNRFE